ncbi:MAG: single-stranded DNA-binding protein [Aphanocapsa lilacina HA4352-LM1]|jgi:single-strand DNA-binding protein|uniref:Single-stranded DNA-binding protein n=1 Tax=Gloeobacter violaceus (strain ATCC 29082 / PCC 7421) TaxID=251221 RepID=Q7NCN6_GLOVI|nr:single-stranded DNA-binding protein [Gloeobacter violaceus]MBW4697260.1 single-stranded DNA-binding protein [Aphanocapsa lilacina HA4352-LM1]BAC90883.1 single-stranded DNA-binding protein [Gloeobacter violaceus PCC 7421]
MSLNMVTLVGRAGRDPEVRYFESGNVKCTLTLAVNRLRRKGEEDKPDWFDLEVWGKTAEIAAEYVRKGSLIGVSGALTFSRWQDKVTKEAKERPIIKVDRLELLGSKRDSTGEAPSMDEDF